MVSSVAGPASVPAVASNFQPGDALFDTDPKHPFNRLHRALFTRKVQGTMQRCLREGSCRKQSPSALLGAAPDRSELEIGGDEPTLFIGNDVSFLAEPGRAEQVDRAIDAALPLASAASPIVSVLLQNDLWERYDSISRELDAGGRAGSEELSRIRRRIVELMRKLGRPKAELEAIGSNLPEVEAAYREFMPNIGSGAGWVEVAASASERPEEKLLPTTRHSTQAGHRMSFRVLVQVPPSAGGGDWVKAHLEDGALSPVPLGTRLALVASPLAVSSDSEVVAVPLVVLVEMRVARKVNPAPKTLDDVAVEVFEGRRSLLTRSPRPGGGLERLPPDADIPMGATCAADPLVRIPLRATCVACHAGASRVTGPMTHGQTRFEVEADPKRAAAIVVEFKSRDPSFAALARDISGVHL